MIDLPNKDGLIFDLPQRIADMIKEYQITGSLFINTNNEGISLRAVNFYNVLDYVCEQFNIDKSKVTIRTTNAEEIHNEYKILTVKDHWIDMSKDAYNILLDPKQSTLATVGCFLGKPNWHRLIISAWLYNNYKSQCIQTMHYNPADELHKIDSEFTKINVEASQEDLESVVSFIKHCPVTLNEGFINYTIGPDKHYNIISQYSNIFLDLVVETYVIGNTFFPTEKTLRPIIASTPFIVMGPQGYLENLRRMGFCTFNKWWDESYDNYAGYQRTQIIRGLLTDIFTWDQAKVTRLLVEMADTLDHNYNHLKKITGSAVKLYGK
ncbi:hypothetical protein UFOVP112_106 [uncultured Caudovirales phage]|uniref:Uncharacterized protein n=1 Tax=uncultured Caudovirales phage TaxID=2100421 RepID=A0A6J5L319_9CAUD|nr:hypothetical protein UFOVP112_106 [uncultured Caudovirales phage]